MTQQMNVTSIELKQWEKGTYQLVDIRDEMSYGYGHLPEAVHIPAEELDASEQLNRTGKVVLYCKKGEASAEAVEQLREQGVEAYHLTGGYMQWLMDSMAEEQGAGAGRG